MKTLKFESKFVSDILSSRKTSTWRLFDDKDLREGDELVLVNKETGEEFAKAVITKALEIELDAVDEKEMQNHGYKSKEQMFEAYKKYYGLSVTPKSILKMVYFEILK